MFFFLLFFSGVTGSAAGRGQPPPTGINIAIDGYKSCDYRRAAPRRSARQTDYRRTMLPRLLLRSKQLVANTNDKRKTTSVYTVHCVLHSSHTFFHGQAKCFVCVYALLQVLQYALRDRDSRTFYNNVNTYFFYVLSFFFLRVIRVDIWISHYLIITVIIFKLALL